MNVGELRAMLDGSRLPDEARVVLSEDDKPVDCVGFVVELPPPGEACRVQAGAVTEHSVLLLMASG